MPVSSKPRPGTRTLVQKKLLKTASELEDMVAERFGVPVVQVVVRGVAPNWEASLIATRAGNAERRAPFTRIAMDLGAVYG